MKVEAHARLLRVPRGGESSHSQCDQIVQCVTIFAPFESHSLVPKVLESLWAKIGMVVIVNGIAST